jgi:hypothetical protein
VMKRSRFYPRVQVDTSGSGAVGQAGGVLLTETVAAAGLDAALSAAPSGWRKPTAIHDPGEVVLDLALTSALGGDCLADVALLRRARPVRPGGLRRHGCPGRSMRWPPTPQPRWPRPTARLR